MADFLETFGKSWELSPQVLKTLENDGFTTATSIIGLTEADIAELDVKKGEKVAIRAAATSLQREAGGGPLCQPAAATSAATGRTIDDMLASLNIDGKAAGESAAAKTAHLKIVDYVPTSSFVAEEEVTIGAGVTLKLGARIKLEKVSPGMWMVANIRILRALMKAPHFDVSQYLKYTEMVGELACRFAWQSVLLFDEEYRQRQAAGDFEWGTDAPHLSTVILRDRAAPLAAPRRQDGPQRRPVTNTGREICIQYNKGGCTYGQRCRFEHCCSICKAEHPAKDHTGPSGNKAATIGGQ